MTEENNKINETNVSEPFEKLNELPTENISEQDEIEAKKIFADVFARVLQGEAITIAEYNIMSNVAKKGSVYNKAMYEVLAHISENGQKAIQQSVKDAGDRKRENQQAAQRSEEEQKAFANALGSMLYSVARNAQARETQANMAQPTENAAPDDEAVDEPVSPEVVDENDIAAGLVIPEIADEEISEEQNDDSNELSDNEEQAEEQNDDSNELSDNEEQNDDNEPSDNEGQVEEQNEDNEPEPEYPYISPLTDEEIDEYISELKASTTEEEYLNSIDPKIKERNIEASMALGAIEPEYETYTDDDGEEQFTLDENGEKKLVNTPYSALENRAIALSNPDDMLVAYNYYTTQYKGKDKDQKIADLKEVINYNLRSYRRNDINPQNAFVLLTLAEKVRDESDEFSGGNLTYKWIREDIALAQKTYDDQNFGPLLEGETREQQAERIEKNYTESLEALENLDSEKTLELVSDYIFTKDNGKLLKNKKKLFSRRNELKEVRESILATARMMVAADLAKTGLPEDIKDNEGKVILSRDEQLMEKMQDAVSQIMQKPNDSKIYTVSEIGGRLGGAMVAKPETFAKRIKQKFKGLPVVQKVKGKIDALDKKLSKNKLFGKAYKAGKKIAGIAIKAAPSIAKNTALFAAAGLVPGGVPALIAYRTIKQWKNIKTQLKDANIKKSTKAGLLIGAVATTAVSAIGIGGAEVFAHNILGAVTRTGISTAGAAMPNIIERASLAFKGRQLKKDLEKATRKNDAAEIARLTEEQKKLDLKKKNVKEDLLKVGVAAALGLIVAQNVSAHGHASNNDQPEVSPNSNEGASAGGDTGNAGNDSNTGNAGNDGNSGNSGNSENNGGSENSGNVQPEGTANNETDGTDDTQSAEERAAAEARANNLAAAEEKGSGHMGKSDMESMKLDMDREAAKIGLTGEQATATMKALAEGYGTESYEAMHASLADPYAFAEKMGITADVMASANEAGIDPSRNFSGAVLNHLATHPELADNEGFKAYVAEHFDEQDRFHYSEQAVHTPHHTPQAHHTPQSTPTPQPQSVQHSTPAPEPARETNITYTPVDHLPGQQQPAPQPTHTETQTTHVQQQATVIHSVPTSNLQYDPLLSQNLNYEKYSGAYIDPNRIIDGKPAVVYMPVDELHERPIIRSMDDAMKMADYPGGDTLGIYNSPTGVDINNPENNNRYGYGYGYGSRVCIGNGTIVHTNAASNDFGKQLGQYVAVRATDIALRQGEHALTHVIENALGRGRL